MRETVRSFLLTSLLTFLLTSLPTFLLTSLVTSFPTFLLTSLVTSLLTSLLTTNDQKINNKLIAISISTRTTDTHSFYTPSPLLHNNFADQTSITSTVDSWLADCTGFASFQLVLVQQFALHYPEILWAIHPVVP